MYQERETAVRGLDLHSVKIHLSNLSVPNAIILTFKKTHPIHYGTVRKDSIKKQQKLELLRYNPKDYININWKRLKF